MFHVPSVLLLFIISGLPYDVGFGQKLFLRCRGKGAPTGICFLIIEKKMN